MADHRCRWRLKSARPNKQGQVNVEFEVFDGGCEPRTFKANICLVTLLDQSVWFDFFEREIEGLKLALPGGVRQFSRKTSRSWLQEVHRASNGYYGCRSEAPVHDSPLGVIG